MAGDKEEEEEEESQIPDKKSTEGVHVFNFKYSLGATPEELRYLLTDEIVKVFGNSSTSSSTERESKQNNNAETKANRNKSTNAQITSEVHHDVFDLNQFKGDVIKISLNKSFVCILMQDGSILRAECKNAETNIGTSVMSPILPSSVSRRGGQQLFQVASDESYAQSLHQTLNDITSHSIIDSLLQDNLRSYQTFNTRNLGVSGPAHLVNHQRDALQANMVLNPLHRLSPTLRGSRYMPYEREHRPNRRHIQMGHLLNTPLSRTVMYSADEDLAGTPMVVPDNSQIGVLDNITIVALENETPDGELRLPNFPATPQPTINVETYSTQSTEILAGPSSNLFDTGQTRTLPLSLYEENDVSDFETLPRNQSFENTTNNNSEDFVVDMDSAQTNSVTNDKHKRNASPSLDRTSSANLRKVGSPRLSGSKLRRETSKSDITPANNTKMDWTPKFGKFTVASSMEDVKFTAVYGMESSFLLLDSSGILWFWMNKESAPKKASFEWNEKDNVLFVGCNLLRATVVLRSKKCATFYDQCFARRNGDTEPTLIKTLSHEPLLFNEISSEDIADVQCSTFFTVIQTISGKAFWWGLAPSTERNISIKSGHSNSTISTEISVGDTVSLSKQDKNEIGALVFNNILSQFGVVLGKVLDNDNRHDAMNSKIDVRCFRSELLDCEEVAMKPNPEVWDCKDIVFLQDQHSFTGKVVSLDGPYAIVKHSEMSSDVENLKVHFKASLEKVDSEQHSKSGRNRYQKYIISQPKEVFINENFIIAAISPSELGITLLVNKVSDGKAFLMYPPCLNYHYSSWFTCGKTQIDEKENLLPDSNCTVEYESTPACESNLCLKVERKKNRFDNILQRGKTRDLFNIDEKEEELLSKATSLQELDNSLQTQENFPKFSRSASMPTGHIFDEQILKRKLVNEDGFLPCEDNQNMPIKPTLYSIGNLHNQCTLLLDNKGCIYPVRFSCCLANPPLLEICPMVSFVLLEMDHSKTDRILTIIAVPKKTPLTTAIRNGDEISVRNLIDTNHRNVSSKKRIKLDTVNGFNHQKSDVEVSLMFDEYSNGNQNIMHVAVANIIKTLLKSPVQGNIMDVRNEEENAILQQLLDNPNTWSKIRKLLCERDSHGCTPFMSAIIVQNLRGAFLILEAIKRNGKNECKTATPLDKDLFNKAICTPTFSGLTPLHALIHNSSKKQSSQQWFNTLKVSNLPPSYSPRLLLKLFKSRFPSVYRAIMPLPKPCWPQRNVRERTKGEKKLLSDTTIKKGKGKLITPQRPPSYINIGPRCGVAGGRYTINRADILRANAKEGLVMFGDLKEMYQAITEMNNHSLLMKNDHPSGALLSVVQHLLQVQQYQENLSEPTDSNIPTDRPNPSDFNMDIAGSSSSSGTFRSIATPQDTSSQSRVETISKCFDDIMVHWLVTSLITCDPSIATSANMEGDSALSYFIKTYPRYSPSHLHKLYLNWRPCNGTNCKYNRHTGKLSITCQSELEVNPPASIQEKKKSAKDIVRKTLHPDDAAQSHFENPILARRGLQYRGNSLTLNVRSKSLQTDTASSPITPGIRILDNLKFAPIEVSASTGLTPQIMHPFSAVEPSKNDTQGSSNGTNISPFFPRVFENNTTGATNSKEEHAVCNCHRSKARLLWNTTFEASVFYLAKNWPCLVGTVMCYKPFPQDEGCDIKLVDSNNLDSFTENLLLNPYSILLEVFIKTLMLKFLESKISENPVLLSSIHNYHPTNQNIFKGKTFNTLLPWLTVQRFVRSLVRQLSLCLSKNATPGANLKYKIGRHANKVHLKKEMRLKDNLCLCLKAFSWVSVLEILRAADAMLKPIRSGTVKAQSKGIIRDIQNGGSPVTRTTFPSGMRMHLPLSGAANSQRTVIRNASRRSSNTRSSSLITSGTSMFNQSETSEPSTSYDDTSDNDDNTQLDDPYFTHGTPYNRNEMNGDSWNQTHVITPQSAIAWAVDGHISRRDEVSSRLLPPPGLWQFNQQNQLQHQLINTPSIHAGYLYLARMFCRLVKEATDLAACLCNNDQSYAPSQASFLVEPLKLNDKVEKALMNEAQHILNESWSWMTTVLNTLESQLTVGEEFDTKCTLSNIPRSTVVETAAQVQVQCTFISKHFVLRLEKSSQEGDLSGLGRPSLVHMYGSTPDEYMMYLLKQDMGEAENSLPVLDLLSYTHMTFVLDAYLYMKKHKPFTKNKGNSKTPTESKNVPQDTANMKFFKKTVDMNNKMTDDVTEEVQKHVEAVKSVANHISSWLDNSTPKKDIANDEIDDQLLNGNAIEWNRTVDAFSTLFLTEGPGYERDSFLAVKAGASGRISRFQRSLSAVRGTDPSSRPYSIATSLTENPALMINVVRSKLLHDCINIFSEGMDHHPFGSLRVRFEGEEGTGPGVNRGLFAAFARALKGKEKYKDWPVEFFDECGSLPSQRGIFSPKAGKYHYVEPPTVYFGYAMTQEKRYTTFLAIGRFLGITLWFNQTIPLVLSRPVLQYLLGREDEISFDDLAFFDSALYQSFSNLMMDALSSKYTDEEFMNIYCFCFEITVDGHTEELFPGGKHTRVTKQNALNYIRWYARHLIITARDNELQGLRDGLLQMIPKELLDRLEPEDLQLLFSGGVEDVSYGRLRSIITFSNSRGCSREILERYKSWFWKIVMKMSSSERQKLLYFATGSSVLPALDNRVGNNEELSITLDIINSTNNSALPMSSTCGQRISMPLYTSKTMLKQKLLQAIECQSYGLG